MYRGYLSSRSFMGERVPQHIQNQVIREFCKKNSLHYLLSATEYVMDECYLMLKQLIDELEVIDGIVFYSLFQLPKNNQARNTIVREVIDRKKILFFAVENLKLNSQEDVFRIEKIWDVKKTIPLCPTSISFNV